jgi:hypothetical protein
MVTPDQLREIQHEMSEMRSGNRWPTAQQERYLKICLKRKTSEPSLNQRACECQLEVMMDKYSTFGDFAKDLVDNGAKPDEQTSGLFGLCSVAFGD